MKIENYRGIDIFHNAAKDEFYTDITIRKGVSKNKDEKIKSPRLQRIRDEIDKYLNVAAKKPVLKKAWLRKNDSYTLVEILSYNSISGGIIIKGEKDQPEEVFKDRYNYRGDPALYIQSKENDVIVNKINDVNNKIAALNKEISCSSGKLIPLGKSHFE